MALSLGIPVPQDCVSTAYSSSLGTSHSKQMPGHYSSHTLRIHGLLNRELAVFMASL